MTELAKLSDLPEELLLLIHSLALAPALTVVSRSIHLCLSSPPGPYYSAKWLLAYHYLSPGHDLVPRALRHAVCTLDVLHALERLWLDRLSVKLETEPLKCNELPKRLFRARALSPIPSAPGRPYAAVDPSLLPFLAYLFQQYSPDPSSHKGFPLCGSITAHPRSLPLTRFLLDKGASPAINDSYAVQLAVARKDLDLVKLLIEKGEHGVEGSVGDRAKRKGGSTAKRRKTDDRIKVTNKMLHFAVKSRAPRAIFDYFMDKGAVPDMKTLAALG